MLQNLTGWHFLVFLLVILLLFGAPKLPGLARSLGQSMRIFKGEVRSMKDDDASAKGASESTRRDTAGYSDTPHTETRSTVGSDYPDTSSSLRDTDRKP